MIAYNFVSMTKEVGHGRTYVPNRPDEESNTKLS